MKYGAKNSWNSCWSQVPPLSLSKTSNIRSAIRLSYPNCWQNLWNFGRVTSPFLSFATQRYSFLVDPNLCPDFSARSFTAKKRSSSSPLGKLRFGMTLFLSPII
eukprot:TRINITY_DN35292_c0_g1_i2.p1 TRINITY_DN35292_c0_g1~~TRINITY_DN35292_c0_g1_i2.p1  ORF type:complete len:104 (-),score=3.82 TRINITY_DN35292_c0_g1_i2:624-935(-)